MEEGFCRRIVCGALLDLARCIVVDEAPRLNERHLHHAFSHRLLLEGLSLGIDGTPATLHPEWPTRKKGAGIWYTTYRKRDGKYVPSDPDIVETKPGFLDFAVGEDYRKPVVGVEFTLKPEWNAEEIVYDLIKLTDPVLPFSLGASLNVILRRNGQALIALDEGLRRAYSEARGRLARARGDFDIRDLFFLVVEISAQKRQSWHLTAQGDVRTGMPVVVTGEKRKALP